MIRSWEIGTLAETLTEYEWPELSVFAPGSIPPPACLQEGEAADVLSIAERCVHVFLFMFSHLGKQSSVVPTLFLVHDFMQGRREQTGRYASTH